MCSSALISDQWTQTLLNYTIAYGQNFTHTRDFRFTAGLVFQLLGLFCNSIGTIITGQLEEFKTQEFVSSEALNEFDLQDQTKVIIDEFIQAAEDQLRITLSLIQAITYANQVCLIHFRSSKEALFPIWTLACLKRLRSPMTL